jgi:hypothetical protein
MPRLAQFVAFLAAVMFMVGGPPAARAAEPCTPCPADCPMMTQAHTASGADHGAMHAPAKGKTENPCKQGLLCQSAATSAALPAGAAGVLLFAVADAALKPLEQLPAASRPPDRALRPPIDL